MTGTPAEPVVLLDLAGTGRSLPLEHGADPVDVLAAQGLRLVRPMAAELTGRHELTLRLQVEPATAVQAADAGLRRDADVEEHELATAVRRRRLAAYALVRTGAGPAERVLLTVLSDRARTAPGAWTMPGGGIDEGEEPTAACIREVWEETGQRVEGLELVGVSTDHWVGRAPDGTLEDFQPIRLLYRATCPDPSEPVVHDIGGTTERSAWVPVVDVRDPGFPLVRSWATVLRQHL